MKSATQLSFVIMPFSKSSDRHTEDYWTKHFEGFLKPIIEENGQLEARRSQALRGDILKEIITNLVSAPIVVADLTDANSNVYWELGVRQGFKHGTVTIAEEGTKLPFDLGTKGTLFYGSSPVKLEEFRKRFKESLDDCIRSPKRPDSYVLETISGRGTLFEIFLRDEAKRRLDGVLFEIASNEAHANVLADTMRKNQENPNEAHVFVTARFRTDATELMLTERYIDEDQQFFIKADHYQKILVALNETLGVWGKDPEETEKYFLRQLDTKGTNSFSDIVESFRAAVSLAKQKVETSF